MSRRVLRVAALAGAAAFFPHAFVFFLPGLALALLAEDRRPFSLSIPLSLAFWSVYLQLLYWVHAPAWGVVLLALVASVAVVEWKTAPVKVEVAPTCLLLGAALFRIIPALVHPSAAGIDMSFHVFLGGRLAAVGVPETLEPLSPDPVRGLPVGFHLVMAAFGPDANSSGLWLSVMVYVALTQAVYRALAGFHPATASALVAVLVCFVAHKPQSAVRYGSNPVVLGFVLALLAVALWSEGMRDRQRPALVALLAAGAAVVHPSPFLGALILLGPAALVESRRRWTRERLIGTAWAAGLAVLFVIPFAIQVAVANIMAGNDEWAKQIFRRTNSDLADSFSFLTWMRHEVGPAFTALGVAALGYSLWRRRDLASLFGAVLAGVFLLALNLRLWFMPMSSLLPPDRMLYFLILPVGAIAAAALGEVRGKRLALAAVLVIGFSVERGVHRYLKVYAENVIVTKADFEAMDWIRKHLPEDAVILNMPDDAGLWIPAFAARTITRPQGAPLYFKLKPELKPSHLYLGSSRDPAEALRRLGVDAVAKQVFSSPGASIHALR